jgi:putative tricarboxylic transport membrane protein
MAANILRDAEVIAGAALAALGVYILLQARVWDYYTADGPGPGFFPTWYGVAMIVLSLALIVGRVIKPTAGKPMDWAATGRALSTWLAFALSVALMGILGFLVSFALLTFFLVVVVFKRSPMTAGATAVLTALGFYIVFPLALSIELPTGFLGF